MTDLATLAQTVRNDSFRLAALTNAVDWISAIGTSVSVDDFTVSVQTRQGSKAEGYDNAMSAIAEHMRICINQFVVDTLASATAEINQLNTKYAPLLSQAAQEPANEQS